MEWADGQGRVRRLDPTAVGSNGGAVVDGLLAFDTQKNYPLPNLFVSMLQRLGVEADKFASSTGTLRGLDPA